MVETLTYNMDLLPDLQPIFFDHIREILADSRYQVRYAAVLSLDRVISAVLNTIYTNSTTQTTLPTLPSNDSLVNITPPQPLPPQISTVSR